MVLGTVILIVLGIVIFMIGLWSELEIVLIIGGSFVAAGILLIFSAIAGYGKSESQKKEIRDNIMDQFEEGMSRRSRYTMNKIIMNDKINEDIKNDVSEGINRSSRH